MWDQSLGSWQAWMKPSSRNHQTDPKTSKHLSAILSCKKVLLKVNVDKNKF